MGSLTWQPYTYCRAMAREIETVIISDSTEEEEEDLKDDADDENWRPGGRGAGEHSAWGAKALVLNKPKYA